MAYKIPTRNPNARPNSRFEIRERSGEVNSADPLVDFLYTLMRDHIPPGKIEELVNEVQDDNPTEESPNHYSNGWLANYAIDVAARLRGEIKSPYDG